MIELVLSLALCFLARLKSPSQGSWVARSTLMSVFQAQEKGSKEMESHGCPLPRVPLLRAGSLGSKEGPWTASGGMSWEAQLSWTQKSKW